MEVFFNPPNFFTRYGTKELIMQHFSPGICFRVLILEWQGVSLPILTYSGGYLGIT